MIVGHNLRELLVSSRYRAGIPQNILKRTGQAPPQRMIQLKMTVVLRLKNHGLEALRVEERTFVFM